MRRVYRWIGMAVVVAASIYFFAFALDVYRQIDLEALLSIGGVLAIIASAVLYALIYPISGWAWARMLADLGEARSLLRLMMIMSITQLAKYVPGNIGQPLGRMTMAAGEGLPVGVTLRTLVYETLLAVLAAGGIGIAALALSGVVLPEHREPETALLPIVVVLAPIGALLGFYLLPHATVLLRRLRLPTTGASINVRALSSPIASLCTAAYVCNYFLMGLGLYLVARHVAPEQVSSYLFLTAAFALSWLAGFITPGAPAGLGIREGVMVAILSSQYEPAVAVSLVLAQRLATTLGDLIGLGFGSLLMLCTRRTAVTNYHQEH